jgi:hypothetical protein
MDEPVNHPSPKRTKLQATERLLDTPSCDETQTDTPPATDIHGRNATALAAKYKLPGDDHASFDEPTHTYTVYGQRVQKSCTGAKADLFAKFDSMLTVRKYYFSWKKKPSHYLYPLIWSKLDQGEDDSNAMDAIVSHWSSMGNEASTLGTLLHLYIELHYNGTPMTSIPPEIAHEVGGFNAFLASPFCTKHKLQIIRTELTVYYTRPRTQDSGTNHAVMPVCAGQIDALAKGQIDGETVWFILDWKRSKHVLKPTEKAFNNQYGTHRITAHIPDTDYHKYSFQLSVYSVMLKHSHGLEAEDRLYLIRMHPDVEHFELTKCKDYRNEATQMLEMMGDNLEHAEHNSNV